MYHFWFIVLTCCWVCAMMLLMFDEEFRHLRKSKASKIMFCFLAVALICFWLLTAGLIFEEPRSTTPYPKKDETMGTSAHLEIGVGLKTNEVFKVFTEQKKRPRYDPETGKKSTIEYSQVIIHAFGKEIELPEDRKLVRETNPDWGFNTGKSLYDWLRKNGFHADLVRYYHTDLNQVCPPTGIVGLSLKDYCVNLEEIDLDVAKQKLEEVTELLKKAGMKPNQIPKLYAHASLC